jgi:hypothetical protein
VAVFVNDLCFLHTYADTTLFGARKRKDEIVGTIAEPRKGPVWPVSLRIG